MAGKKHLTPRNERFVLALFTGAKQIDAYITAYKPSAKANRGTLHNKANKLAKDPKIKARLAELMAPVVAKVQLTRERWLQEVVACAIFDPRELFDSHGNCIEIKDLPDHAAPAIASFEQFEEFEGKGEDRRATGYTRKFKLVDKLKALELAGKAYKFYEEGDPGDKTPKHYTVTFVDKRSPYAPPPPVTVEVPKVKFVTGR